MPTVTAFVHADPDACFRAFIDVPQLPSWVPGLKSAETLRMERGLPAEIHFEYGSFAYTIVYQYDRTTRTVRFEPKLGKQGGVSGSALFEARDGGTQLTYTLEPGPAREPVDMQALVDAFVEHVNAH
ncbi:MAG: hypothetical protein QM831_28165 [Kofleriaceae bacterium]